MDALGLFKRNKSLEDKGFASYGAHKPRKSDSINDKSKSLSRGNSSNNSNTMNPNSSKCQK